jgi:hypothetical protein
LCFWITRSTINIVLNTTVYLTNQAHVSANKAIISPVTRIKGKYSRPYGTETFGNRLMTTLLAETCNWCVRLINCRVRSGFVVFLKFIYHWQKTNSPSTPSCSCPPTPHFYLMLSFFLTFLFKSLHLFLKDCNNESEICTVLPCIFMKFLNLLVRLRRGKFTSFGRPCHPGILSSLFLHRSCMSVQYFWEWLVEVAVHPFAACHWTLRYSCFTCAIEHCSVPIYLPRVTEHCGVPIYVPRVTEHCGVPNYVLHVTEHYSVPIYLPRVTEHYSVPITYHVTERHSVPIYLPRVSEHCNVLIYLPRITEHCNVPIYVPRVTEHWSVPIYLPHVTDHCNVPIYLPRVTEHCSVLTYRVLLKLQCSNLRTALLNATVFQFTYRVLLNTEVFQFTYRVLLTTAMFQFTYRVLLNTEVFQFTYRVLLTTAMFQFTYRVLLNTAVFQVTMFSEYSCISINCLLLNIAAFPSHCMLLCMVVRFSSVVPTFP